MRIYGVTEELEKVKTNTTDKGRKQIVNQMIKKVDNKYPNMNGYSIVNNRYAFLDGHRVFIYDTDLDIKASENPYNINGMLNLDNLEGKITIPRAYVEYIYKANKDLRPYYPMVVEDDGFYFAFNPKYLLDAIKFSNSETFYYEQKERRYSTNVFDFNSLDNDERYLKQPLFQKNKNGDITTVILPVSLKDHVEEYDSRLDFLDIF